MKVLVIDFVDFVDFTGLLGGCVTGICAHLAAFTPIFVAA
jgi:hypothetical protein